ncbi:glycolipid transfer protein-like [Anticarsia gemmatalis]|uniref:glycolipid transfer protein-like n=1 Tax=Anticarsia gemmatalis TaxID=129554 RepID=UPI003F7656F7
MDNTMKYTGQLPMRDFPPVKNGRINCKEFLASSSDLVIVLHNFGAVFTPVRVDVQRNVNKMKKTFICDENSCLLELMTEAHARGDYEALLACLWLNRGLKLIELFFEQILTNSKANIHPEDMDTLEMFTKAYDGSLREHHNWIMQQLFEFICRMFPTLSQMMKSVGMGDHPKEYLENLERYNKSLTSIRTKLDNYFKTILDDLPLK